jgi:hypothetical protein
MYNIPKHPKVVNVVPLLTDDTGAFYFKVYMESGCIPLWPELSPTLIQHYNNAVCQQKLLFNKMRNIQYFDHLKMADSCYSVSEVVYELQNKGSDTSGLLRLMMIDKKYKEEEEEEKEEEEEEEEEGPLELAIELLERSIGDL